MIDRPGGPDVLHWTQVPDPKPRANEVVVSVAATAVNRADLLQRQGRYDPPAGESPYLGLECSGVVAEVGEEVDVWRVGDEVCALLAGGGYAERVAVPADQLLPIPAGVSLVTAASLPEAACTVWSNLVMTGHLRSGQTVLLHGGASGIGTMGIQVAAALGARVAVTAGSRDKLGLCASLGAEILVNYREDDFVSDVRAATGGRGADLVLDIMGASYLARNLAVVAQDGKVIVIGMQGGTKAEVNLGALLSKRATLAGTTLRGRSREEKARIVAAVADKVWPMIADGRVRPVVDRVMSIERVGDAHRLVQDGAHAGKVVLAVGSQE